MNTLTPLMPVHWKLFALPEELFEAIQTFAEQEGLTPCELVAWLLTREEAQRQAAQSLPARWERLTPRERQIVQLVGEKLSSERIAVKLGISPCTVKSHLHKALAKLGLRSPDQLPEAVEGLGVRN